MILREMTQYLIAVQGMPKSIENTFQKMTKEFIWKNRKPLINKETLSLPREQGGLKILNIKLRNQAIEIMWLKRYLDLSKNRPKWAYITDILIEEQMTKASGKVDKLAKINIFLQTWKTNTSSNSKLKDDTYVYTHLAHP